MEDRKQNLKLPAIFMAGSFLILIAIAATKNPTQNVSYIMVIYLLLLVIIFCLGYILLIIRRGSIGHRGKQKLAIISTAIIFALMFKSTNSLNWIDALVLIMITLGLLFYTGRRAR